VELEVNSLRDEICMRVIDECFFSNSLVGHVTFKASSVCTLGAAESSQSLIIKGLEAG
jgi:hypothetical protein